ncbi:peptidase inhibitor family I36 protein [Streptomyces aureocirculatus]|uniref:peptidase inhibitor family I36 protein n=1 Tax=Streptomyces aureocirculatus TaxID=67275 RepID=UPI00099C0EF3|nr:peptidase inhibitor family I36 protein [Streptomyces aureocirculatus]
MARTRTLIAALALGGACVAVLPGTAGASTGAPATAQGPAAVSCSTGYACIHYHPNREGAVYKSKNDANHGNNRFVASTRPRGGNGAGQTVRNNAASVDNWNFGQRFRVYKFPNYQGTYTTIAAGGEGNLGALRNDNASGKFL